MEFTLLAAAVLSVGTMLIVLRLQSRARAEPIDKLADRALGAIVVGLVVGRLTAMVVTGTNPLTHPADVIVVRGGVSSLAATVGAMGYLALATRTRFWQVADALAPAALAGLAVWHGACTVRGSCLGTATALPWGLTGPGSTVPRHPVEVYAALFLVAGALLTWWLRDRPWTSRRPGVVGALAFAIASLARLVTEPVRPAFGSGLIAWYLAAVVIGVAVVVVLALRPSSHAEPEPTG